MGACVFTQLQAQYTYFLLYAHHSRDCLYTLTTSTLDTPGHEAAPETLSWRSPGGDGGADSGPLEFPGESHAHAR
jgi:hypothetical protein